MCTDTALALAQESKKQVMRRVLWYVNLPHHSSCKQALHYVAGRMASMPDMNDDSVRQARSHACVYPSHRTRNFTPCHTVPSKTATQAPSSCSGSLTAAAAQSTAHGSSMQPDTPEAAAQLLSVQSVALRCCQFSGWGSGSSGEGASGSVRAGGNVRVQVRGSGPCGTGGQNAAAHHAWLDPTHARMCHAKLHATG